MPEDYQSGAYAQTSEIPPHRYRVEWAEVNPIVNAKIEQIERESEQKESNSETSSAAKLEFIVPDITSSFVLAAVLGKLVSNCYDGAKQVAQAMWSSKQEKFGIVEANSTQLNVIRTKQQALLTECQSYQKCVVDKWQEYHLEDLMDEIKQTKPEELSQEQIEEWQEELKAIGEEEQMVSSYAKGFGTKTYRQTNNCFFRAREQQFVAEKQALPQAPAHQQLGA